MLPPTTMGPTGAPCGGCSGGAGGSGGGGCVEGGGAGGIDHVRSRPGYGAPREAHGEGGVGPERGAGGGSQGTWNLATSYVLGRHPALRRPRPDRYGWSSGRTRRGRDLDQHGGSLGEHGARGGPLVRHPPWGSAEGGLEIIRLVKYIGCCFRHKRKKIPKR